jgi:hypothetical protein
MRKEKNSQNSNGLQNEDVDHKDHSSDNLQDSRRDFLKKAAYTTPVLIALGQLVKPTDAQADSTIPPPPPGW